MEEHKAPWDGRGVGHGMSAQSSHALRAGYHNVRTIRECPKEGYRDGEGSGGQRL